jgi:hypothetical protein
MRKLGLADSQLAADNLMAIIESIKKGQTIIIDLDDDLPMEIDPVLAKLVYESVKNCDQEELVSRLVSYDYITDIQAQQLTEQLSIMTSDQKEAIPHTYVIPKLHNTDPYIQYRYGVALATAKGEKDRAHEGSANNVGQRSEWGEALAIIDYDGSQGHAIDLALKMVGLSSKDKVAITSKGSRETGDVHNQSPVAARKELKDLYK